MRRLMRAEGCGWQAYPVLIAKPEISAGHHSKAIRETTTGGSMGTDLFAEIARTNGAWCESRGLPNAYLSDEERNGKALSEPELERARVIDLERSRAISEETRWLMARNPHWSARKASLWAAVNFRDGISNRPRAVVEYAMPQRNVDEAMARFGEALGKYYAECRARPGVTWTGD